jgi:transketolase
MRKEFSLLMEKIAYQNDKIIFLTGDLGFMALENIRNKIKKRFINVGVSEQNMIAMAAAIASEGFTPICYSIASFVVFRPAEQIRIDVCLHNMNVKLIGNGGGYGYGIMGATHHAIEDLACLSSYQNMKCFIPFCNEDVKSVTLAMMNYKGPSYLRLGYGQKPGNLKIPAYQSLRHLLKGEKVTILALGPVALNVIKATESLEINMVDLFVISEIPIEELSSDFIASLKRTKKLIIIEEHVQRGGVGEYFSLLLMKLAIYCKLIHLCAKGYPNMLFGSQQYHQKISSLDPESIVERIKELVNDK